MNTATFIEHLWDLGVEISVRGDRLRLEAPKGVLTGNLRSELGVRKAEILAFLAPRERAKTPPPLVVQSGDGPPPLAFQQIRLWFLYQLEPHNPAYNNSKVLVLSNPLDPGALAASLNEVIRRHAALRTSFATVDGQAVQVVAPCLRLPLAMVDLQRLDSERRRAEAERLTAAQAVRPFDLMRGPLVRALLLRTGSAEHRMPVTVHHILADAWSMVILVREIVTIYEAFSRGEPCPLPEPSLQYVDFTRWQQQWLQGEALEDQLDYWKEQLAGSPPILELPTDRPRPAVQTYPCATAFLNVPKELRDAVRSVSQRQRVTLFVTLVAAYKALLSRISGQEDVLVGTPMAYRNWPQIEELIGFFANSLVLRTDLSADPSVGELLRRVQGVVAGAIQHQDMPFEKLVEELQPERSLSYSPIFQAVFSMHNFPREIPEARSLKVVAEELHNGAAKYDLQLHLADVPDGLTAVFEYNTDLFDATTMRRFLGYYRSLLAGAAENPETRLSELRLLTAEQVQQLLLEWNDTASRHRDELCIHQLFEEQTARRPETIAALFGEEHLSYGELNRRANSLAHRLAAVGVGPDAKVGISIERSLDMLVGLMGIHKAGAAHVPLDPSLPQNRLTYMMESSRVPVVLTHQRWVELFSQLQSQIVCLDREPIVEREDNPVVAVWPDNVIYVMYTSGSTGLPKGVANTHRNIVRLLREVDYADLGADQVLLQAAPLSFDASTLEIWGALIHGGRLVVLPPQAPSLEELADAVARYRVSLLWLTAGLFHQMVEWNLRALRPVRQVLSGGDVLSPTHVRRVLAEFSETVMVNGYGPTENGGFTCCRRMQGMAAAPEPGRSIPIGPPIADTQVFVLDRRMKPVPMGVAGMLYGAGSGVARGYADRPKPTAEAFVPSPLSRCGGERLYRTGDHARWLSGGELEFLGRADTQIKVRGFRIELREIEVVLSQHAAVQKVVVLARQEGLGDKRLVAYVVPADGDLTDGRELKRFLADKLPEYMVPAAFVILDDLPLTHHGKIDRDALPVPDWNRLRENDVALDEPRTPIEEILASIWAEVFGLERVGIHEDFFELGGHSLMATRLVSRVRQAFSLELPLRVLFEEPTVADLAATCERELRAARGWEAPPLEPLPPEARAAKGLPLSFAQERLWFLDQLEPDSPLYNVPFAVRIEGPLELVTLERSLNEVVRRHEVLRTTFAVSPGGEPLQVIAPPALVPMPLVDLGGLGEQVRDRVLGRLVQTETGRPFALACGPMLRASLIRLADQDHALMLTMHHIVSDGWSMGILTQQVAAVYHAFHGGSSSPLRTPAVAYADFAAWQRQWLSGEVLAAEIAHWRERLSGAPPLLELPSDRPRPAGQTFRGAIRSFRLEESQCQALKAIGRQRGATLFMTLLAGFQTLLGRYTGRDDVSVGTSIAGRNRLEIEDLIGFFVNTLVLRTDLSGDPGFLDLVERVREITLGAYAHQDMPFEKLVEELEPERSLSYTPLFQVLFSLQNAPQWAWPIPGLTMTPIEVATTTAKFDLSVELMEIHEGGIFGMMEYSTDLFDAATVERLIHHYRLLLRAVTDRAEERLARLAFLGTGERHQLLVEWSDTRTEAPVESVAHLLEVQVERSPEAMAAVCDGVWLSYGALDRRASRMAQALACLGTGRETVVAILAERGVDLLAAMLAIFKAGGTYLPLDPLHPSARIGQILDRSAAPMVLVGDPLEAIVAEAIARLPEMRRPRLLRIEDLSDPSGAELPIPSSGDQLAYVIYTSGSTGVPKGAMVTLRGMVNHLRAKVEELDLGADDVVIQTASQCFDISIWQFLAVLLVGGRVEVVSDEIAHDPERMLAEVDRSRATVFETVPSLLHFLLEEVADRRPSSPRLTALRWMIPTGESLPKDLARRWLSLFPNIPLLNAYGPTECSDDVSHQVIRNLDAGDVQISIGRPLRNLRLELLDRRLTPTPLGVPGELCVGGIGVGRGYWREPARTARVFVPHARGAAGGRLYRTGDLARTRPGGSLVFLGRIDFQVKVRGFRIELGEIEVALGRHEAVERAVVVARSDGSGGQQLVAYVVARGGHEPPPGELHRFLRRSLPAYMVPAVFVVLGALPLTRNGKVDRKALARHAPPTLPFLIADPAVPATTVEQLVARIWREVLGLAQVRLHDNFFELGGHSLLATKVVTRVRQSFRVEVPLRTLFEAQTVAALAARIEEAMRVAQITEMPALEPVARDRQLPLSFAQERLWFLHQLEPDSPSYNMPIAVRFEGPLSIAALSSSLDRVVQRHEVLRTSFPLRGGTSKQEIAPPASLPLPLVDLQELPEPRAALEVRRLAWREWSRPFDLARGPVLRTLVTRLGGADHVILGAVHHVAFDGWSENLMNRELAILYEAALRGRAPQLPELTIQYADFAHWQRRWLRGKTVEAELAYWRERLAGAPPLLELPTDRPRTMTRSYRGARRSLGLSARLWESLNALAQAGEATLFMTLLAAYQALLARYSGQDDISVGTALAGRNWLEVERLLGLFVNLLVMRTDLSGDPDSRTLLARVREVTLDAHSHQNLPFEKLVVELEPERSLYHSPLFQATFVLDRPPEDQWATADLRMSPLSLEIRAVPFDLSLVVIEGAKEIQAAFEFSSDLFDATTITRLLRHYQTLLQGIVERPEEPVAHLPLLAACERGQLLREWNDIVALYPAELGIHQLFEQRVKLAPEAIAVAFGAEQLSYLELNCRANRLAHHLRQLEVAPEVRIGLFLERSAAVTVALLAILKAGGAYVPLDPGYPSERLAFMLEDSGAEVVVGQESLLAILPQEHPRRAVRVVLIDRDRATIARKSEENPAIATGGDRLAYVIYTSGSTGTPKGVAIPHRGVVRLVMNTDYIHLGAEDGVAQASTTSFDAATFEIWGALLHGARLAVISREAVLAPGELVAEIRRQRISTMFLTTALFNQLSQEDDAAFALQEHLLFGGEAVDPSRVRAVLAGDPPLRLLHVYGPTESTTFTTWHRTVHVNSDSRTVPIGRPIANTEVYVLDRRVEPVPLGVVGQVSIGGDGLARGYHNRSALTAEVFTPHPFGSRPGDRLYRTGDKMRSRADGAIEFVGRVDHQVKVRGFRIELGEIEAALGNAPGVREAVVVVREEGPESKRSGEKRLVAYVVPAPGASQDAETLRSALETFLPKYMVPSAFVWLEALPLNPNGKVDREALPDFESAADETGHVAPRTPEEELLAGIMAEVLGVERVGVEDDFFDLGGHSLLATQLITRVRQVFAVEIPLYEVFEEPTVAHLADSVSALRHAGKGLELPPMNRVSRHQPLPLSFAQQRLWFLDQLEPNNPAYNIPVSLRAKGRVEPLVLAAAFSEVVRRHEVLRTRFSWFLGETVQEADPPEPLDLSLVDLSTLPPRAREAEGLRLAAADVRHPFDLVMGPLLRTTLVRLAPAEHLLLVNMHHIVSDGWSMGVLTREIATLYSAFIAGRPSPLPELEIQYADFAVWQRGWLREEALEAQLAYWRERLEGAPPLLRLPIDRPRPAVMSYRGEVRFFKLPAQLWGLLGAVARSEGATLFMTLLAAFQVLLSRYSGQTDVSTGTPIAGRNRREIEDLIGFFVNTLVIRSDLAGDPQFSTLVRRVRETTLGGYAHQDLPFEKLVEELEPERDLSYSPLFQVMFVFQNAPQGAVEIPGLAMSPLEIDNATTQFDLTLSLWEAPEGVTAGLEFNTDLFDGTTVGRLQGHFEALLGAMGSTPGQRITELPLLTSAQRCQLQVEWGARTDAPAASLPALFAAQVERTPEAVGVNQGTLQLTYGELDRRSERLARLLRSLGAGPERLVALMLDRSLEMVVAILGVLKAGSAYLPLDPSHPAERLAFTLEDAGAEILLTCERQMGGVPTAYRVAGHPVLCLDRDWPQIGAGPTSELGTWPHSDQAAYVIYTSGSTGRPKGTAVTHRNVTRLLAAAERVPDSVHLRFDGRDVWTLFHSYAFDFSVWELWGALAYGGRLVVVPYHVSRRAPEEFLALLVQERVTVLNQTPSAFRQLVVIEEQATRAMGSSELPLRLVIFGGEALEPSILAPWFRRHGDRRPQMVNMFGITETTVHVTYRLLSRSDPAKAGSSPIGVALSDLGIYLLERRLKPVPIGVPGEIFVAGAGLARGYLRRPALTAERFVPDPFSEESGARLYRTGDLARRRANGELDFLGRIDHQIQLRGFRVELGEIGAVLNEHPEVREAVVLALADQAGEKRLVAYVVPEAVRDGLVPDLRSFLSDRLPDHMVPATFVPLDAFPLTPQGKLDRLALPAPDTSRPELRSEFVAPRNEREEILTEIWTELLGLERVGRNDNFFELGGQSLLATQVIFRLQQAFGVELALRAVFQAPTVAGLAARVEEAMQAAPTLGAPPPLEPAPRDGDLPLSFAQQRLWFHHQLAPEAAIYNLPTAVRLKGQLHVAALKGSLNGVFARHEALRTTFPEMDIGPVQQIAAELELELPLIDLRQLPSAARQSETSRLTILESRRLFDLEKGPLLRSTLLWLDTEEHVLLLIMHHIVTDGWSNGIFVGEMAELYRAFVERRAPQLAPLPIQYADYAVWQRRWLSGAILERQLAYWKTKLGGLPTLKLPTDRPRPVVKSWRGSAEPTGVSRALTEGLRQLSLQEGTTLFTTLLASFYTLLYRYTGQEDLVVGTAVANRNRSEVEGLIGFFVNTLALRTDLSGNPSFRELISRVREVAFEAYSYEDLPFDKVVQELQPDRTVQDAQIFRAAFGLQDVAAEALELPGLHLEPVEEAHSGTSRFDLAFSMVEIEGGLAGVMEYDTELFDRATIAQMLAHYLTILKEVRGNPEWRILDIPLGSGEAEGRSSSADVKDESEEFDFEL